MHQDRRGVDVLEQMSVLTSHDVYLFNEGTHYRLYDKLGAHTVRSHDVDGTYFAVWAPNAERVSVIGSFNDWSKERHPLRPHAKYDDVHPQQALEIMKLYATTKDLQNKVTFVTQRSLEYMLLAFETCYTHFGIQASAPFLAAKV